MAAVNSRFAAEDRVAAVFGQAFDRYSAALAGTAVSVASKANGAARLALENAVRDAAAQAAVPNQVAAQQLAQKDRRVVRAEIEAGKAKLAVAFGAAGEGMLAAAAGYAADLSVPRPYAMTDEFRGLISEGQALVRDAVIEQFSQRGTVELAHGNERSDYVVAKEGTALQRAKSDLVKHVLFINGAIDQAVNKGTLSAEHADTLKQVVDRQIFQRAPEAGLSAGFRDFQNAVVPRLRDEVMQKAVPIAQHPALKAAAAKLNATSGVMPAVPGKTYDGVVEAVTDKLVTQRVDGKLVGHDLRSFTSGGYSLLKQGNPVKIAYTGGLWKVSDPNQQTRNRGR